MAVEPGENCATREAPLFTEASSGQFSRVDTGQDGIVVKFE